MGGGPEEGKSSIVIAAAGIPAGPRQSVTVASYNIHGSRPTPAKEDGPFDADRIAAALRLCNPDVVCLQEVLGVRAPPHATDSEHVVRLTPQGGEYTQAHAIAERLGMGCVFVRVRTTGAGLAFGNAILSRWPMAGSDVILLGTGSEKKDNGERQPGSKEERGALVTTVAGPGSGFLVLCTHFGIFNTADTISGRCLQPVERIKAYVKSPQREHLPALLCGDLNARPSTPILQALDRNWNVHAPPSATSKGGVIDYICDRGVGKYKMRPGVRVISDAETGKASDHCPIVAVWDVLD